MPLVILSSVGCVVMLWVPRLILSEPNQWHVIYFRTSFIYYYCIFLLLQFLSLVSFSGFLVWLIEPFILWQLWTAHSSLSWWGLVNLLRAWWLLTPIIKTLGYLVSMLLLRWAFTSYYRRHSHIWRGNIIAYIDYFYLLLRIVTPRDISLCVCMLPGCSGNISSDRKFMSGWMCILILLQSIASHHRHEALFYD